MDAAAAGTCDLPDRAGFQPAGGRPARRLRPAAVLLLSLALCACGKKEPQKPGAQAPAAPSPDEVHRRFIERDWKGLEFDGGAFVKGLGKYIADGDVVYPVEGERFQALHEYLYASAPDPADVKPLLGARTGASEIEAWVLRRDYVALAVVTSFYRRLDRNPDDRYRKELWDALAYAGVHFSFDPLYENSHTRTGAEIADLFIDPQLPASADSAAALEAHLEELLAAWRKRVTEKASTTMMAILIRHLSTAGADRLFAEWKQMSEGERFSFVKQLASLEKLSPAGKAMLVEQVLSESADMRGAVTDALEALGAPIGDIDVGTPDEELRKALPALREWAAETDS